MATGLIHLQNRSLGCSPYQGVTTGGQSCRSLSCAPLIPPLLDVLLGPQLPASTLKNTMHITRTPLPTQSSPLINTIRDGWP